MDDTRQHDREHSIRVRAFQIWESEGRPVDRADEHWETARQEIEAAEAETAAAPEAAAPEGVASETIAPEAAAPEPVAPKPSSQGDAKPKKAGVKAA
jgi:hypothetical protein